MEKINFKNGEAPYINDTNLNQMQDNTENAIKDVKTELEKEIGEKTSDAVIMNIDIMGGDLSYPTTLTKFVNAWYGDETHSYLDLKTDLDKLNNKVPLYVKINNYVIPVSFTLTIDDNYLLGYSNIWLCYLGRFGSISRWAIELPEEENSEITLLNAESYTTKPIDNLESEDGSAPLSANQGRILNNKNTYSTEEQEIGTWIDGKPIYKKTYVNTVASGTDNTFSISDLNYDSIWIDMSNSYIIQSNYTFPLMDYRTSEDFKRTYLKTDTKSIRALVGSQLANTSRTYVTTFNYTKTTD